MVDAGLKRPKNCLLKAAENMAVKDASTRVYAVHERSALGVSRWEDYDKTTASWHIETQSRTSMGGTKGFSNKESIRGVG